MSSRFPTLSNFLERARESEKQATMAPIVDAQNRAQQILNSTAVTVSAIPNAVNNRNSDFDAAVTTGIQEAVVQNMSRVKSIIGDLFESVDMVEQSKAYWIDRLSNLFNISMDLPLDEKMAQIDYNLAKDQDILNMVTSMVMRNK